MLDDIEREIFTESLQNNTSIEVLRKQYSQLIQMRNEIFDTEEYLTLEEVGQTMFKVTECILNVRIMIREKLGLDVSRDVGTMNKLWAR